MFLFGVFAVPHATAGQFHLQNVPKISTGLSPFFCWACLRFRMVPQVSFTPKMCLNLAQDYRQFCVWRFCGSAADRMSLSAPKCASPIC